MKFLIPAWLIKAGCEEGENENVKRELNKSDIEHDRERTQRWLQSFKGGSLEQESHQEKKQVPGRASLDKAGAVLPTGCLGEDRQCSLMAWS